MNIRKYENTDIYALHDILDKDLGYNTELSALAERVNKMINCGNYHIFVACDNNRIVGFIGFVTFLAFEVKNECIKIIALAVSKEYRRKGIGTELLKVVEEYAGNNNIQTISLNSGLNRKDAHFFYENQGYFKKSYGFIKQI